MNIETPKNNKNHIDSQAFADPSSEQQESLIEAAADDELRSSELEREDTIKELKLELEEAKDRHLRALADQENMRRRHERERADLLKYASEKLLQDLMPVLDGFEKAVQLQHQGTNDALLDGVKMIHKQFIQILDHHGLKAIDAVGKTFDPNFHQAIQKVEVDDVQGEIVKDEFQKGYVLNGRLIRPSMVSVLVPKTSGQPEES